MKKFISFLLLILFSLNYNNTAFGIAVKNTHKINVKSGTPISIIIPVYKTSKNTIEGEQIPAEIYKDVFVDEDFTFSKK